MFFGCENIFSFHALVFGYKNAPSSVVIIVFQTLRGGQGTDYFFTLSSTIFTDGIFIYIYIT